MQRLEDFRDWYTTLWASLYTSCLPEELALPDERFLAFDTERMLRDARLSDGSGCEFGVFAILGPEEAHRAATIWSPVTRLITQEISLAFKLVERQRQSGEIVSGHNIARVVETLHAYFQNTGRSITRESLQKQVTHYLSQNSLPNAETISECRLPVKVEVPLLDELRIIDKEMQAKFVDMHGRPATMHWLGLGLDEKLDDHRYAHCTPLNCRTFAGTGGDGHHFSFLVLDGQITESSPIVSTTPDSCGIPSTVVAGSLHQFLRFGCANGYDALGYVFLQSDEDLEKHFFAAANPTSEQFSYLTFERGMLAYLRQRLKIEPSADWRPIRDLQQKYNPLLRHPPDVTN
jgi:hypothetical protein